VRWAQELAGINFRIYYLPGNKNGKPDVLSRRSEYHLKRGGEIQPIITVLQRNHLAEQQGYSFICSSARRTSLVPRKWNEKFREEIREASKGDPAYRQAWEQMEKDMVWEKAASKSRKATEKILSIEEDLLYRKNRLWVMEGMVQRILECEYDTRVAGNMGQDKTIELLR